VKTKARSKFFGRHKILLPGNCTGRGVGFCKKKQRFFISYQVNGELERRFIDAKTHEEAVIERERIFTEMLLSGAATRIGEKVKGPRKQRTCMTVHDKDAGLLKVEVRKTFWRVYIDGRYRGTRPNKEAAIKLRMNILAVEAYKPCKTCGKRPVILERKGRHFSFQHAGGCPNAVWIRRISKGEAQKQWNTKLWKRGYVETPEEFDI
jgi:hypothetical protein